MPKERVVKKSRMHREIQKQGMEIMVLRNLRNLNYGGTFEVPFAWNLNYRHLPREISISYLDLQINYPSKLIK